MLSVLSERSGIFRKTLSALKEIWSLLPAVCSAGNMHFFGHQVLILFWTHLPCFFSILSVCMPGLFCSAAFWLVRIAYCGRLGRGAERNRAIKRFRNRAISNRDFISIYRTALIYTKLHMFYKSIGLKISKCQCSVKDIAPPAGNRKLLVFGWGSWCFEWHLHILSCRWLYATAMDAFCSS